MQFFPDLNISWLNGWILLVIFYVTYSLELVFFPKKVRTRLFNFSNFTKTEKILNMIIKLISISVMVFFFLNTISNNIVHLLAGGIIYSIGLVVFLIALNNFLTTPINEPVIKGFYKISRNPQEVGLYFFNIGASILLEAGFVLLLVFLLMFLNHFKIRSQERFCLEKYGDEYKDYMAKHPRYLLFF